MSAAAIAQTQTHTHPNPHAHAHSCGACKKPFSSARNLGRHLQRQPLCARWLELSPGLKDYVQRESELDKKAGYTCLAAEREYRTCPACGHEFASTGNLNRHLAEESSICAKWARLRELQPVYDWCAASLAMPRGAAEHAAPFEAPDAAAAALKHVIWNVMLCSKDVVAGDPAAFKRAVEAAGVARVVGIMPEGAGVDEFHALLDAAELPRGGLADAGAVERSVLPYAAHEPSLDVAAFDAEIARMEALRARGGARRNVLVFCNSGYQRSIPFLAHYLVRHHGDEAPDVARAIDLILPQVDRDNYAALRDGYVESVGRLLLTAGA